MKKIILFFVFLLTWGLATGQNTLPQLRLNTKMHTARINRLSTDALGRYILTASFDKTAKLWDTGSGDLIKTFRPPIGPGNEGMLYCCALSPDGDFAAVSGFTSKNGINTTIYIFDTYTGDMTQRLTGLGNVVDDLEFAPNGNYLAAALHAGQGVVIYQKSKNQRFTTFKTLSGYKDIVYNLAFDQSGRLATVCYDGKIRLYDNRFKLILQRSGAGKRPFSIAFSPEGSKIAVGYSDTPTIEVRSGRTLEVLYYPDVAQAKGMGDKLNKVAFSADGRCLYGGGIYDKSIDGKQWRVIRCWQDAGKGRYRDYPACKNTVIDIKPLPGNDLIYAGTDPDLGRLADNGSRRFYLASETNNYNVKGRSHLKINYSGDIIAFKPSGKQALLFSLTDRKLQALNSANGLDSYIDKHSAVSVSDWAGTYSPKINDQTVEFLEKYERCRSADISSDGRQIVLGTGWHLYSADPNGTQLWKTDSQSTVWSVNISGNGNVVVSAQGNGVIEWYRMSDGKPLLSLYVHPESRQWIVFTANGYYDASPGAERYIGWHLNQGPDATGYFFPVSKFRSRYYRPDVIDNLLVTLDEGKALRLADTAGNRKTNTTSIKNLLPPVVSIVKPSYNQAVSTEHLTIEYTAESPDSEPIMNVRFMIDGRPVENQRGLKMVSERCCKKTITIPKRNVSIQVLAENRHGWSAPAEVKVKWKGEPVTTADPLKPTLYVLAIGVSDYQKNDLDLNYAAKDARDFAATMQKQQGGLYKNVETRVLIDASAKKLDILDGLDWIQKETTSRDLAMIFIAGHGVNDNVGSFHYLPYEADLDRLRRTGLLFTEFKYTASVMPGKLVMFVDACHSGNAVGNRRAPDVNLLVNELSDVESGAVVFTSSTGKQYSLEDQTWGNGAFTKALIEGMNGKADLFQKGRITIKTLDAYIAERVKTLTDGRQSPTAVIPQSMPDFPIGLIK
ncbi:hypothetical protein GF407_03400 [candidate division KSB1 bacterium]|nr:hypothetical protein [candidate division KSB1 bacterium]